MASKGAKAFLIDSSIKRLQANLDKASELIGVDPLVIPSFDRDPEYLMGTQLEAMANWTEALAKRLKNSQANVITESHAAETPDAEVEVTAGDRDEEGAAPKTAKKGKG